MITSRQSILLPRQGHEQAESAHAGNTPGFTLLGLVLAAKLQEVYKGTPEMTMVARPFG